MSSVITRESTTPAPGCVNQKHPAHLFNLLPKDWIILAIGVLLIAGVIWFCWAHPDPL